MRKILIVSVMLSFTAVATKVRLSLLKTARNYSDGGSHARRAREFTSDFAGRDARGLSRGRDADRQGRRRVPERRAAGEIRDATLGGPTSGPASAARQFTRGEKSVSIAKWSPDGKILAFTMDAGDEKDAKPQVWFMYADGGEAWQVTKHKSGVTGYEFSPDGEDASSRGHRSRQRR